MPRQGIQTPKRARGTIRAHWPVLKRYPQRVQSRASRQFSGPSMMRARDEPASSAWDGALGARDLREALRKEEM